MPLRMRASELIERAVEILKSSDAIDHWQKDRELIETEELLMHVMGGYEPEDEIPPGARRRFEAMVARRATGEPVPFITGLAEFRRIDLIARPGVFVPRGSSEFLAEQAVRRLRSRRRPVAVDLATGGGTIALAIANEVPRAEVFGADVSPEAVKLARANARRLGLRASFRVGDLFDGVPGRMRLRVHVVTLHPPYVPRGEVRHLPDEIRDWEPAHTLTDNSVDGMGLVQRAVAEGPRWLAPGGWLLMEVSPDRSREVMAIYRRGGFREVRSTKGGDLKVTRVVVGRRPM
jgi:release factor glutamine methyltransferase